MFTGFLLLSNKKHQVAFITYKEHVKSFVILSDEKCCHSVAKHH